MEHASHNLSAALAGSNPKLGGLVMPFFGARPETARARIRLAILAMVVWTAIGLFQTVPEVMFRGFIWYYFVAKLIEAWAWALLTPAILLFDRKLTSAQPNVVRLSALHLILSVPFSLVHTYLAGLLQFPIVEISWNPLRNAQFVMYYFLGGWMTYCAVVGVLQMFKFNNRFLKSQFELERVEKRLIETRLNVLRLQLEPHFLFNTLNAISSEVAENPVQARQMIEDLGALLRRSLESQDSNEITLAQELALLDRYLAIQKLRFGKRIDIRIDVDPESLSTMVPSMLLQPLVEHAIRPGIESRMSGGMVALAARREGRHLLLSVIDDGVGLPKRWRMEACAGLGLRVTRERLEALYSGVGEFSFVVAPRKGGGTNATIHIPLETTGTEGRETAV
jgi:two-component system, LytTR family, sensor kinase